MQSKFQLNEVTGKYEVKTDLTCADILDMADSIVSKKYKRGTTITCAADSKTLFISKLRAREREIFAVLFLDNRHQVIEYSELFSGTIDAASVYPREIVKQALLLNSAAIILSHNHPSGVSEPSESDIKVTKRIKAALELVDIRLLDHIIVGGNETTSLTEKGII